MLRSLFSLLFVALLLMAQPAWAADLRLTSVTLAPCDAADPGSQPPSSNKRGNITSPEGASCYVLSGNVSNPKITWKPAASRLAGKPASQNMRKRHQ